MVLGVGGNVSQGIIRALKTSNLVYDIIGACIDRSAIGLYMCDKAYISPLANDEKFMKWLIEVCNSEEVDIILTGVEEIIEVINSNYDEIKEQTKTIFVSSSKEQLTIGRDKLLTCKWLEENDCRYPQYAESENAEQIARLVRNCGYHLIAKPRRGKGSQGIMKIENEDDLKIVMGLENYIVQEYIGNEDTEYTVGCYCDKNSKLIDIIIMHRELKHGTTFKATVVENMAIREQVVKICDKFKPIGPLNIQLRMNDNNEPVCFELNIRLSGTTPMRAQFGYNDVEAMIKEYVYNEDITNYFNVIKGTAYRYWNEIYIDEVMEQVLQKRKCVENVNIYTNHIDSWGTKI
jgi:carbamoyl-phosphate synthase large subunit